MTIILNSIRVPAGTAPPLAVCTNTLALVVVTSWPPLMISPAIPAASSLFVGLLVFLYPLVVAITIGGVANVMPKLIVAELPADGV